MPDDFKNSFLGRTGLQVHRLGFAGTYRPGKEAIHRALDAGVNYFFFFGIDTQLIKVLRDAIPAGRREDFVLASGGGNFIVMSQNLQKSVERRLRQLKTDYIDIYQYLGIYKEKHFPDKVKEELLKLKETGKVRFTGISCHHRQLIGKLAREGEIDVFMLRYNAAHRGAEQDIFPFLAEHNPGVVSYTATRWGYLLRRPKGWPADGRVPTAAECYRFVLTHPAVHVVLTSPRNLKQTEENLKALGAGPLPAADLEFMKSFGDAVHAQQKKFRFFT
jgi:aryl-alcohol dehydrogenase-like predicted oxidoreductase